MSLPENRRLLTVNFLLRFAVRRNGAGARQFSAPFALGICPGTQRRRKEGFLRFAFEGHLRSARPDWRTTMLTTGKRKMCFLSWSPHWMTRLAGFMRYS